jgi:hypothetical protein
MAEIAGLKLIVPSSVAGSGVSVSASGKVTFTGNSGSIVGIFSATYDNYLIVMQHNSGSDNSTLFSRLRSGSTDASGNNYVDQRLVASSTSVSAGRQGPQDQWLNTAPTSTGYNGVHIYLYGPYLAQPTAIRTVSVAGGASPLIRDLAGTHSLSNSYDGFTFTSGFTGSLCVYGLSQ